MLNNHVSFHAINAKRQILVADDELINRELLGVVLSSEYDVIFAADGQEAMEKIEANRETLSLVLLDLLMPVVSGMQVLRWIKENPELRHIPVIVVTSDQDAEIESLGLGAIDFIPKPYPQPGVMLARVLRTIELSEDRDIIKYTERDSLTGLYNREYFYRYAQQFDQHHKDLPMDAVVIDVNHFHMINERYGKAYGDEVLTRIGEKVRDVVRDSGGIVCRHESDTFLIYCPHRTDYREILDSASIGLAGDGNAVNRVRLRMGIYPEVDKSIEIERRFDRAKIAADTVRNNFSRSIAIYDNTLHESEIYAEQLLEDFPQAIAESQLKVYYQPKFDIRPDIPVLTSAEALVRWIHPKLGMISPGVFIPLFENNGLIQQLDHFVWREAAAKIRDWKDRLGISVPVSVNVSRVDMYDPALIDTFQSLLEEYGLEPRELLLEITESAYTQDSQQIISTVNRLRALGFRIEMDDFGTGYSSLNMISSLPIDALKLDMKFIRSAFQGEKDTRMIEVIIDIADYLSVPVIAEGVETVEQLNALKAMGCDIVQGYYFSKPVPAEEYERFVEARRHQVYSAESGADRHAERGDRPGAGLDQALTTGFERIYYVDAEDGRYVQFSAQGADDDLQIERSSDDFFTDCREFIARRVCPEDRERVSLSLDRAALIPQLIGGRSFSMTYRLLIDGEQRYYNLRAVNASARDNRHIVIGVSNIDDQMKRASAEAAVPDRAFTGIAEALSGDYECVYYVDTQTGDYRAFSTQGRLRRLNIEQSGRDFFGECRRNIPRVVFAADQAKVASVLQESFVRGALEIEPTYSLVYRLQIDESPVYYRMKMARVGENDRHVVIGLSDIDEGIAREQAYNSMDKVTYTRILRALSRDYYSIYYVDTATDEFIEYSSGGDDQEMKVEQTGTGFFEQCRRNLLRLAYKPDLEKALTIWDKARIMKELEGGKTFSATYRLVSDGIPIYINCKVLRMIEGDDDSHLVIGISNVDTQMRRDTELSLAWEKANRDALTGVKSKHAYIEAEAELEQEIKREAGAAFAVVVCDINELKHVNDTRGHQAGDKLIRDAAMLICNVFKHSPVFRVGGDEFVAILRGQDYENRAALVQSMMEKSREDASDGLAVAIGIADFIPGVDQSLSAVFDRADSAMYQDKGRLKRGR